MTDLVYSPKIRPEHLARRAIVYLRQSSEIAAPDSSSQCALLSRLFRRLFLESTEKAFNSGKLQFFAALEFLRDPHAFAERIAQAKQIDWVVYTKRPFAGPQQGLD